MKNYLLPFVLILIFSCGKEEEPGAKSSFPEKYTFTEFDYGTTTLYEINSSGYDMIPLSGSFITTNLLVADEIKLDDIFSFSELEFVDEQNVNVTGGGGLNSQIFSMEYQTDGNRIALVEDGVANFLFEKDEANKQLRLCYSTNWGTYLKNNGDLGYTTLNITAPCTDRNMNEIIESIVDTTPEVDTIAVNFSNDIFDLVE